MTPHSRWGFVSGLLSISPLVGMEIIAHTLTHTDTEKNKTFVCLLDTDRLWRNERVLSLSVQEQKREIIPVLCVHATVCVACQREKAEGMTKEKESQRESVPVLSECYNSDFP